MVKRRVGFFTAALLQYLLRRGVVVSQRVARVAVLVQDVRVGDLVFKAPRDADVRLRGIEASAGGRAYNLGSECPQNIHLARKEEIGA